MADFKSKLQKIRQLRQKRDECDEQLYFSRLELYKTENLVRKLNIKETTLGDKKNINELRSSISTLEGRLHDLNRRLNKVDHVLDKKKENDNRVIFLKKKIVAVEAQLRGANGRLTEERQTKKPDRRLIDVLGNKIKKLDSLLNGLRYDLQRTEQEGEELLQQQQKATTEKDSINEQKKRLKDEIVGLEKKLSESFNTGDRDIDELRKKRAMVNEKYSRNKENMSLCIDNLQKEIEHIYIKTHPSEIITKLDDSIPFLLLPVRIETRFIRVGNGTELWLRIYPDDIAIHTHEKLLTDEEVVEGIKYWKELFNAAKTGGEQKEDLKKSAWSNIASLFGPQRSAWIAKETKPTNWTSDLNAIETEEQLHFPTHDQTKTDAWSRAPRTKILPDKFVVMLYESDTKTEPDIVGPVIPDELFVGPDPLEAESSFESKDDKLLFGESFNWMSDFDKAVLMGMGFKIPLTSSQASNGFKKILVLGVCLSADETESKQKLEELIDNHHYSPKGFSIVLQGTPTNNTEQDGSGYSKSDPFNDISYFVETGDPVFDENTDCDGRNLAYALGIEVEYDESPENPSERRYGPLQFVLNSNATDYKQATLMNRVLYPATLGYFFETLLEPVFSEKDLDTLRKFFVEHVTGRGPLPAIRVGNQPYGILLTSDFGKWWNRRGDVFDGSFLNKLCAILFYYQRVWDSLLSGLMYVGKAGEDPSDVLMNILGLQAGSISFYQRVGYSTDYLRNLDQFQSGGKYWSDVEKNFSQKNALLNFFHQFGYNTRDEGGSLKVPQALRLVYQHYNTPLDAANLIEDVPLSEKDKIRYYDDENNYLHWLAKAYRVETLQQQNFGTGKTAPKALLYMMLRRALLLQLHKASVRWFKRHDIVLDHTFQARNFHNIRPEGDLTKYEVMRAKVGTAVPLHPHNMMAVSDYLLTSGRDEEEAHFLNEMRASLEMLAELSTGKLERCFTEHIDACTYRLDAWQIALFRLRLLKQRNVVNPDDTRERKKGIYIGAYGWIEDIRPVPRIEVAIDTVPEKLRPVCILNEIEASVFENRILNKMSNAKDREYIESCYLKDNSKKAYLLKKKLGSEDRLKLFDILKSNRVYQPLFEDADNGGLVHAPSINHASTAAVLRSGYLSHASQSNPDMMAVNLSSERVRRALFILQGIRNGQPLEALLGYQFERGLHDKASGDDNLMNLNLYIYDFRGAFPFQQHQVRQQGSSDVPTESMPAGNVVNGVALAESKGTFPYGATGAVAADTVTELERKAIEEEKYKLEDSLDAVKDLLLGESTYQLVQGNFDRSGAILNALKDADIPPELDIINTPRTTHFTFTNRVTIHFENADPDLGANNPWNPVNMTPRARMEAGLNKWLGNILGGADDIVYRVAHLDANGNEVGSGNRTVEDLDLQPIDLVYIIGNELNTGAPGENTEARTAASELESRIVYHYRQVNALDDEAVVRIEFMKPENKKTLGQLLPLLRMLKSMITDARHVHAEDFSVPSKTRPEDRDDPNCRGYDLTNLRTRIEDSLVLFRLYLNDLGNIPIAATVKDKNQVPQNYIKLKDTFTAMDETKVNFREITFDFNGVDAAQLQNVLIHIADFGLPDAFPKLLNVFTDEDKMILLEQARSVARRAGEADAKVALLRTEADAATEVQRKVDKYIAAGKALLGDVFNILPLFSYRDEADIQQSDADRSQLLKYAREELKMTFVADEWLQNVAHVRPKLARWEHIRTIFETFNGASLELKPVQLPYRARDSWLAVEFPEAYEILDENRNIVKEPFNITHDTLSVVVHGDSAFTPTAKSGLLIDDWTEVIPTKEEVTGITFNYSQPGVFPPQALLLAVTPREKGHWMWDDLVGILNDTLQRAKRRAVEPIALDKVGKPELGVLLPALVSDFSQYDLDVALDYRLNVEYLSQAIPVLAVGDMAK